MKRGPTADKAERSNYRFIWERREIYRSLKQTVSKNSSTIKLKSTVKLQESMKSLNSALLLPSVCIADLSTHTIWFCYGKLLVRIVDSF